MVVKLPTGKAIMANILVTVATIAVIKLIGSAAPALQRLPLVGAVFR